MQPESTADTTLSPLTLDAADTLSMTLERIEALFDVLQQQAEDPHLVLTLAHLGAELTEKADHAYDQLRRATREQHTNNHEHSTGAKKGKRSTATTAGGNHHA